MNSQDRRAAKSISIIPKSLTISRLHLKFKILFVLKFQDTLVIKIQVFNFS